MNDTRISRVLSSVGPAGVKVDHTPALRARLVAGIALEQRLSPRGPRSVFVGEMEGTARWISLLSLVLVGFATKTLGRVADEEGAYFALTADGRAWALSHGGCGIETLADMYRPKDA